MLASPIKDVDELEYPLLATPKLDGIRAITRAKVAGDLFPESAVEVVSRYLNPIPNAFIQKTIGKYDIEGLDGEIITYTNGEMDEYNEVQSKVMSENGAPDFFYHVFDTISMGSNLDRGRDLANIRIDGTKIRVVIPHVIENSEHLYNFEERCLKDGYEGVITRNLSGPYKFGRSTWKQQWMLKLKRFKDAEATVIGFEELMINENEQEINELGLAERSDHKANKRPGNTLGALLVHGHNDIRFSIGSGFDEATRLHVWRNQDKFLHKLVKFKYQPHGVKHAPRCPIFLGWRET